MKKLLGALAISYGGLLASETWTCNDVQWTLMYVTPPDSTCVKGQLKQVTQIGGWNVWVKNQQSGLSTTPILSTATGVGWCDLNAISKYLAGFTPYVGIAPNAQTKWWVEVANYKQDTTSTGSPTGGYTEFDTTSTPLLFDTPACSCMVSDCKNVWRPSNQCTLTCSVSCTNPTKPKPITACSCPGYQWYWSTTTCSWYCDALSPILLSDGHWNMTGPANGVWFDFTGTGPILLSWTAAGSRDAWLVLDRNGNGAIDNAYEMFGNATMQPPGAHKNGFRALAMYDENHDGVIDSRDAVFSQLRYWVDANHNGASEPWELFTAAQLGIAALSLDYEPTPRLEDTHGNHFKYRAAVRGTDGTERWMYDVFLQPYEGPSHNYGTTPPPQCE